MVRSVLGATHIIAFMRNEAQESCKRQHNSDVRRKNAHVVINRPSTLVRAEDEVVVDGIQSRTDSSIDNVRDSIPGVLHGTRAKPVSQLDTAGTMEGQACGLGQLQASKVSYKWAMI